jgi:hypothetical protein
MGVRLSQTQMNTNTAAIGGASSTLATIKNATVAPKGPIARNEAAVRKSKFNLSPAPSILSPLARV